MVYANLGMKAQAQNVQRRLLVLSPDLAAELEKMLLP
jgi:hypothetical protein